PSRIDGHKDQHVRTVLAPVARLAEETQSAIIGVTHLNKGQGVDVMLRASGSIAFIAAARSYLVVGPAPGDESTHVLAQGKSNLGKKAPSLRYRLESRSFTDPDTGET